MNKSFIKKSLPYVVAIVSFLILAAIYCYPLFEGKVLQMGDLYTSRSISREASEYNKTHDGEYTYWTNSLFSGMPTYQISYPSTSKNITNSIYKFFHLYIANAYRPIGLIFFYFVAFFVLLNAFGINKWLSIGGAIAISLSSYFFIIIPAGHIYKADAIGCMACVVAGFYLLYRKKYLWGVPLVMIFSSIGVIRHPQMAYYYFLMLGIFFIAELIIHIKEKKLKSFFLSSGLFVAALFIGLGTEYGAISTNRDYVKESMRGGHSEISSNSGDANNEKGLSYEYASANWSYGKMETMTLLIPNFYGGASGYDLPEKSNTYEALVNNGVPRSEAKNYIKSLPMYWGPQSFTSGPVYVGAIIVFLFVFGLIIVKGPYKWAILVATIFSILLSWGSNFTILSKFFFNYFPMYNKFRAMSSILVVAELCIPLLAFLSIKTILDNNTPKKKILMASYISCAITAGTCIIFALFGPSLFSFSAESDAANLGKMPQWFISAIQDDRKSLLRSDALRSFIFIILAMTTMIFLASKKVKAWIPLSILSLLIVADLWPVNRRYFGKSQYISAKEEKLYFAKTDYEEKLLKDKTHFRVFTNDNPFNNARTSYYLKSIGGYHGAKLRRYQDLIEQHLSKNNFNVYNMLNTKYFLIKDNKTNNTKIFPNNDALGNAWFIDTLKIVNSPDEESNALNKINPRTTAVTDSSFKKFVNSDISITAHDSTANITLTKYEANLLEYDSYSNTDKTAVFSEIYYPNGWKAYIDSKPVEHFRVNYVLRALNIPSGKHHIKFEFKPDSVEKGNKISLIFVIIMLGITFSCIAIPIVRYFKKEEDDKETSPKNIQ